MPSPHETIFNATSTPVFSELFSVDVVLSRDVRVSDEFNAKRRNLMHEVYGQEIGLEAKITLRVYELPVASCVIDGETIEPRTGDKIHEGSEIYEIQPPDNNTPSVKLKPGGFEWIVHTSRIE